ncbi:MAG: hypothetical protein L0H73_17050 [Nitrococcus sp.]|nr:hypothetical protein [Nitrococcus sp.]
MSDPVNLGRLLFLMETVERQGRHLLTTTRRLFSQPIDPGWVEALGEKPELAERLDAFVARFARMQDTIGDRLIPELRRHLLETPGAALDNLNRMEKLGLLSSVVDWVEARNLRNRLVHEYMRDPEEFACALQRAHALVPLLIGTYNALNAYAKARFASQSSRWPAGLGAGT